MTTNLKMRARDFGRMKTNLKTIKLKIRAYNTGRATLEEISKELEDFEEELQDLLKPSHVEWIGCRELIKEILGE